MRSPLRVTGYPAFLFVLAVMIAPSSAQDQQSIRIADTIWGFDDRVMEGQFVPLSILLDNLSDEPIEGTLRLHCVQGMLNAVGGDFEEPLFLGATSRRWVQFYPYIADGSLTWHLTLTTEEKEITFDPIPMSQRILQPEFRTDLSGKKTRLSVVMMDPPGRMSRVPKSLKHMPDDVFPPYATATHSLYAVFLDHVPNWDEPRQQSFMSWLRRGGRLHLLKNSNNQEPRFSGEMISLNEPLVEFRVGGGFVVRHDYQRESLPDSIVENVINMESGKADLPENIDPQQMQVYQQVRGPVFTKTASQLFVGLRELTNPEHNWILLTIVALIYIGLLFPGSFIFSKKPQVPFYATYLVILGMAVVFSMLFLFLGRRGYGESTAVNSLMIARAETNTAWDVFGLSHVFVTAGDDYTIEDSKHQTLLASGSDSERVAAQFMSGNNARFSGRIPPYSGQPIISQRQMTLSDWKVQLLDFKQNQQDLTELSIQATGGLPTGRDITYRVLHGRKVYSLTLNVKTGVLSLGTDIKKLIDFCDYEEFDPSIWWPTAFAGGTAGQKSEAEDDPRKEFFRVSERDLLARSLLDDFAPNIETFELPAGEIRLLVYGPIPPGLELPLSTEANRDGRILYVYPMRLEVGM